ncbi:MAG TPA: 2-amino-4-hydroxy-6-hydroxymethyldihydropteridine diphosphokinase [Thermoanaerobaculia bacterium]|nr:2-amino-4-hydroxy-6-hydroxymethyldihydropteridine diphosphokinase [Thermoanaerobaculia bacterium]
MRARPARPRSPHPRPVFVAIGLGSNEGRREDLLRRSIAALAAHLEGLRSSPFYESSPVPSFPPQPDFLNAVVVGRTKLSPGALLTLLRKSETAAGRKRAREARNGPRPLDLDILLYGNQTIASRSLTVPHPRMVSRLFVLVPLADLAPRRVVPGTAKTVARLLAEARGVSSDVVRPWRRRPRPSRRGARTRTPSASGD